MIPHSHSVFITARTAIGLLLAFALVLFAATAGASVEKRHFRSECHFDG